MLQHFSHFCSKLRLWVEMKTAISERSNGYPKSCFGAKDNKNSVSPVSKVYQDYFKSHIALFYTTQDLQTASSCFKIDLVCGLLTRKCF